VNDAPSRFQQQHTSVATVAGAAGVVNLRALGNAGGIDVIATDIVHDTSIIAAAQHMRSPLPQ
jgi:hypothetical protein